MNWVKPRPLSPGAVVRVVAPAGPFDRATFERGLEIIAARYRPKFDPGLFEAYRYLAGDDARRARELNDAFADSQAQAVFCARGGYGSMRLLPKLAFPDAPRLLVGFSDITALHATLQARGHVSLHAPVLTQLANQPRTVSDELISVLEGAAPAPLQAQHTLVEGVAEGRLIGGNLAVLSRLIGTPFFPSLAGAVLLLEDVGERPYRLDRMWTHLRLSGALSRVAGIALGDFTGCEEQNADYTSLEVLRSLVQELNVPCALGFSIGHGAVNSPVLLGCRVRLDASARRLEFLEQLSGAGA